MDRTSKTHVCPLLIACFLGFSLGTKGQVELISSDTKVNFLLSLLVLK